MSRNELIYLIVGFLLGSVVTFIVHILLEGCASSGDNNNGTLSVP